jgi:hypothetical protein
MSELILPGVYIDERPEGLIVGGPVSVGNIGVFGTASTGPAGQVQILSTVDDAYNTFGAPGAPGAKPELTLVRAIELAYLNGASTVMAVRVVATGGNNPIPGFSLTTSAAWASLQIPIDTGGSVALTAKGPGAWANEYTVQVQAASAPANAMKVTITNGREMEAYLAQDGVTLASKINASSKLVSAQAHDDVSGLPSATQAPHLALAGGKDANDATPSDYISLGLNTLLQADAQIIVAAGLDITKVGQQLKAHVELASNNANKSERIGIVGCPSGAKVSDVLGDVFPSDRIVFVAPSVLVFDANGGAVTPTGEYAAAAVAGLISSLDVQASPTNKTLTVAGLQSSFNAGQLQQLVEGTVLAIERRGSDDFRVVKGVTTDTGGFRQITTRRIVDLARKVVRASADPYIGLLNNERVRGALKTTINGALALMVDAEQLEDYTLDVTATRDQEIRGIAQVVMSLKPTFSIDYIQVTMYLG